MNAFIVTIVCSITILASIAIVIFIMFKLLLLYTNKNVSQLERANTIKMVTTLTKRVLIAIFTVSLLVIYYQVEYSGRLYHDESGVAMGKANAVLNKYCQDKNLTKQECTEISKWTNTNNGGIAGNFYTIADRQTINAIIEIYTDVFYEGNQEFDVIVNFYKRNHKDSVGGLFFRDEPFAKLELKRKKQ